MFNNIEELLKAFECELNSAQSIQEANNLRVSYLGKSGYVTELMKELKQIPPENKKEYGLKVNLFKTEIENSISKLIDKLKLQELESRLSSEKLDITLSINSRECGTRHPLTIVREEIIDIFTGMGFLVTDGPEIESDYYNFQALNIPTDHPAREMQDTFYITDSILLRTHTSPMQVRTMEKSQPPIRILNPGKVYRSDDDATHSPMFQQIEGLVVDKNINLCDLMGLLEIFAKKLFNADTKVRFRPSHFPFTEPSVEVDVSCAICKGAGCRLCKGTGWIEILGAGVVNPKVLGFSGIDSKEYSGLAFGLGIERVTMIKYGIPDMRILFENDTRFLKQFIKVGE